MKYYLIAGEASGDLHASNLMKSLLKKDENADFRFWGGDLMSDVAQQKPVKHYKDLAFMGFIEVLMNLKTILGNIKVCKKDIEKYKPDVIIFIDYPGFNMRIAKWAKERNIKTFYYISPQIWAWKENRIKAIKRDVDEMFVILPFEKSFYEEKHNFPVHFVGHPLLDAIDKLEVTPIEKFRKKHDLDNREIIAILPGSRKQEIVKMLSTMLDMPKKFEAYQFIIAGAPSQEKSFYEQFLVKDNVSFVTNETYQLLSHSKAAMVTSGTATLETALFDVPEVVCYKGSEISYQIAKRIIKLNYISLVNLIMDQEIVKELIQNEFNAKNLEVELKKILDDKYSTQMKQKFKTLKQKLGGVGASDQTADLMLDLLQK
ncbi:lipid-A-disaccharide synthase [Psychroflexus halocasei]|uniref:Lipid-A-disaccharide synthase n=1 Tax=Psychroflexus halocasei TaxID=908615 RepID=A0A1H3VWS1_9FLAO|nr:lipid-A-disaccharide synthase [Psychroflexus halocasei]SDZ78552.1 lipid-A-disaccharide synthase [Psychroflexus halocasei]